MLFPTLLTAATAVRSDSEVDSRQALLNWCALIGIGPNVPKFSLPFSGDTTVMLTCFFFIDGQHN